MQKRLVLIVNENQYETLNNAAEMAGSKLGPWIRIVGLAAARDLGIKPAGMSLRQAEKAEHEVGVAERRDLRNAKKAAIAERDMAEARYEEVRLALGQGRLGEVVDEADAKWIPLKEAHAAFDAAEENCRKLGVK